MSPDRTAALKLPESWNIFRTVVTSNHTSYYDSTKRMHGYASTNVSLKSTPLEHKFIIPFIRLTLHLCEGWNKCNYQFKSHHNIYNSFIDLQQIDLICKIATECVDVHTCVHACVRASLTLNIVGKLRCTASTNLVNNFYISSNQVIYSTLIHNADVSSTA